MLAFTILGVHYNSETCQIKFLGVLEGWMMIVCGCGCGCGCECSYVSECLYVSECVSVRVCVDVCVHIRTCRLALGGRRHAERV